MIHINSAIFFFSANVSSCKSRPRIIVVVRAGFRPFGIELHRCQTSCGNSSHPSQTSCVATSTQPISVNLTALIPGNRPGKRVLINHTSCGCNCLVINHCKFDEGELPDEENCRCIKTGPTAQGNEKGLCA